MLVSTCGTLIPIVHIETMQLSSCAKDTLAQKLADDMVLRVRTLSGKEYACSMKENMGKAPMEVGDLTVYEFYSDSVYESWSFWSRMVQRGS